MKLTKQQALEMTRDLWSWIAETGATEKIQWPGWGDGIYENHCPCCEYAKQATGSPWMKYGETCTACPLLSLWPDGCEGTEITPMREVNTPWARWCVGSSSAWDAFDIDAAKLAAAEIANAAQAELRKLKC